MAHDQLGIQDLLTPVYFGSRNVNLEVPTARSRPRRIWNQTGDMPPRCEFWQFLWGIHWCQSDTHVYAGGFIMASCLRHRRPGQLAGSRKLKEIWYGVTTQSVMTGHVIGYVTMAKESGADFGTRLIPGQQAAFRGAAPRRRSTTIFVVKFGVRRKKRSWTSSLRASRAGFTPADLTAFRTFAQKKYLDSTAKTGPRARLERINACSQEGKLPGVVIGNCQPSVPAMATTRPHCGRQPPWNLAMKPSNPPDRHLMVEKIAENVGSSR